MAGGVAKIDDIFFWRQNIATDLVLTGGVAKSHPMAPVQTVTRVPGPAIQELGKLQFVTKSGQHPNWLRVASTEAT